jgi:hypothetical protein
VPYRLRPCSPGMGPRTVGSDRYRRVVEGLRPVGTFVDGETRQMT